MENNTLHADNLANIILQQTSVNESAYFISRMGTMQANSWRQMSQARPQPAKNQTLPRLHPRWKSLCQESAMN
eukprot:6133791-Amphidinium_carterae.1